MQPQYVERTSYGWHFERFNLPLAEWQLFSSLVSLVYFDGQYVVQLFQDNRYYFIALISTIHCIKDDLSSFSYYNYYNNNNASLTIEKSVANKKQSGEQKYHLTDIQQRFKQWFLNDWIKQRHWRQPDGSGKYILKGVETF